MSDIKLVIGADVSGAVTGLRAVQGELGKTATISKTATTAFTSIGSSISSLGSSLISGGVITGIALLGTGLIQLGKYIFGVTKEQERLNDVISEAKGAFVKATLEVERIRDAFEKAEKGIISKENALKLYNSTIGKTIGETDDLNVAEKTFTDNSDKYVQAAFLRAAANIALGKSAEAAFKAEEQRQRGVQKESILSNLLVGTAAGTSLEEIRQKKISDALEEQTNFKKIYNALLAQANALGITGLVQEEGIIGKIRDRIKELQDALPNLKTKQEISLNVEETKRLNAELDALLGKGQKLKSIKVKVEIDPSRVAAIGNIKPFEPKLRGDLQTIFLQDVILKPSFKVEITEADRKRIAEGLQKLFDIARIEQLSEDFAEKVRVVIESTIEDTIIGLADAAGTALAGGRDVIPNLFGGLMNNLGQQIQELGKFLIRSAIQIKTAKEAFQKLLSNPVASAIVGIGLVALGALLKQQASKQYKGFASGTTGVMEDGFYHVNERGRERIFLPRGSKVQPNNELQAYNGGGITLMPSIHYSGDGFRIMLNKVDAQWRRNN